MGIKFFLSIHNQKYCLLSKERNLISIEELSDCPRNVKPLDILEGKREAMTRKSLQKNIFAKAFVLLQQNAQKFLFKKKIDEPTMKGREGFGSGSFLYPRKFKNRKFAKACPLDFQTSKNALF